MSFTQEGHPKIEREGQFNLSWAHTGALATPYVILLEVYECSKVDTERTFPTSTMQGVGNTKEEDLTHGTQR